MEAINWPGEKTGNSSNEEELKLLGLLCLEKESLEDTYVLGSHIWGVRHVDGELGFSLVCRLMARGKWYREPEFKSMFKCLSDTSLVRGRAVVQNRSWPVHYP